MERFVRAIVGGGLALVAGLWALSLSSPLTGPWLVGALLAILGTGGLAAGIGSRIEY